MTLTLLTVAGLALLWYLLSQAKLFHTCAYFGSLANVVDTDIAALADDIIPISNTHFLPYKDYQLVAGYASAVTLLRAKLKSGTIAQINPSYIRPVNAALLPANNPNAMMINFAPFTVHKQEELQVLATDSAAGPNNFYALLWLQSQYQAPPAGPIWNVRLTSTTAAGVSLWTTLSYTLESALPAGKYAIVGSEHFSTNAIAHRWIFDNQVERPGMLSSASNSNRNPYDTYYGRFGVFGYFFTYSLPRLQVLCNAADASHEAYMQLVPVGPSM